MSGGQGRDRACAVRAYTVSCVWRKALGAEWITGCGVLRDQGVRLRRRGEWCSSRRAPGSPWSGRMHQLGGTCTEWISGIGCSSRLGEIVDVCGHPSLWQQ